MTGLRRVIVIGGGIIGLAVADAVLSGRPGTQVTVLEKESGWARHQSGRNSGVLHSGIYYPPGSLKATMCRAGAASMLAFAREHGIPHAVCGKLVVATTPAELARLAALAERGRAGGLTVRELTTEQLSDYEPHVRGLGGLHVAETGVVDYGQVCRALAERLVLAGATLRIGVEVLGGRAFGASTMLQTTAGDLGADLVVNCAGLQSDIVARRLGHRSTVRIVPFRGEYRTVRPEAAHLVRGLVYPVPDPDLPFLGVHLTRGVGGHVHAGPNAVLALAREGYRWLDVSPGELVGTMAYPGLWRLALRHGRTAAVEAVRSASPHRFGESVRRLVPELRDKDLLPSPAGVRAQAVRPDGRLVDDFLIETDGPRVHVLNAPSPAATSAFAIAAHVVGLLPTP